MPRRINAARKFAPTHLIWPKSRRFENHSVRLRPAPLQRQLTTMEPNRILPDLQSSLLCEQVRQEINGNLFLLGVIGLIAVPQFPVKAAQVCVFNRWTAGLGEFVETVRILAPDQTTVLRTNETRFALKDAAHHVSNVNVFGQLEFQGPGVYFVEVLVDQVMKIRFPVPVLQRRAPQSGGPGAKPAEEPPSTPPAEDKGDDDAGDSNT